MVFLGETVKAGMWNEMEYGMEYGMEHVMEYGMEYRMEYGMEWNGETLKIKACCSTLYMLSAGC